MAVPTDLSTQRRVHAYLEADTRYAVAPVPAPIDAATATAVALGHIRPGAPAERIMRLSRLCVLHDLSATAEAWAKMLAGGELTPEAVARSAWSIAALAWLGTPEQKGAAAKYFPDLLERADPERSCEELCVAADALNDPALFDRIGVWLQQRADRLEADAARPEPGRPAMAAQNLSIRADMLVQQKAIALPRAKRCVEIRLKVEALPLPARIPRLAGLYAQADDDWEAPLVWSSACALMRLPWKTDAEGRRVWDHDTRTMIVDAFLAIARAHERDDPERPSLAGIRWRALHAASYFLGVPTEPERVWLYSQTDYGTEILVKRPDWEYPGPHAHGQAPGQGEGEGEGQGEHGHAPGGERGP
jgi:hypothetical protein